MLNGARGVSRSGSWHAENPVCRLKNASVCAFQTSPCMPAPRAHVVQHVRVVLVHTGTFLTYTRGRFEWTHGGQGVITSSAYQEFAYHVLQRFTKETFGSFPFSSLRKDRERHVPASSNHLLHLIKLLNSSSPDALRRESATGWFDLSFATNTQVSRTIRTPDTFHDVRLKEPLTFHNDCGNKQATAQAHVRPHCV